MTESVLEDAVGSCRPSSPCRPVRHLRVLEFASGSRAAIARANVEWGLALA